MKEKKCYKFYCSLIIVVILFCVENIDFDSWFLDFKIFTSFGEVFTITIIRDIVL